MPLTCMLNSALISHIILTTEVLIYLKQIIFYIHQLLSLGKTIISQNW